jgi:hypothetical protein
VNRPLRCGDNKKAPVWGPVGRLLAVFALGVVVQYCCWGRAEASTDRVAVKAETSFVGAAENIEIFDGADEQNHPLPSANFWQIVWHNQIPGGKIRRGFSTAYYEAGRHLYRPLPEFGWQHCNRSHFGFYFGDNCRRFPVVFESKLDLDDISSVGNGVRHLPVLEFGRQEQIGAFDARNMVGGLSGCYGGSSSSNSGASRCNVSADQIAYLDARNENQSAGEDRENGSIKRDGVLSRPVPGIGKYIVVFCFILSMLSARLWCWRMGAFR